MQNASSQTKIRLPSKSQTERTKNRRKTAKITMQTQKNKMPQALTEDDFRSVFFIAFSILIATRLI